MVDVGDVPVEVGDEVVLIGRAGRRGDHRATSGPSASDTIAYRSSAASVRACRGGTSDERCIERVEARVAAGGAAAVAAGAAYGAAAVRGRARPPRARRRRAARRSTRRSTSTTGSTSHDGGSIYVVEAGEGPPIVLSHGVTLSVRTWFHQLETLPEGRASARSRSTTAGTAQSVLGEAGHSLENLAEDVRTVRRGLDLRDAVLVGHSMGGVAVQAFVIRYPELAAERVAASCCCRRSRRRRSVRARRRRRRASSRSPTTCPTRSWLWDAQEPRVPRRARSGFGKDPHPSHVELVRRMMLGVPARDPPRRAAGARRPRPHARTPEDPDPDARDRRHRRRADAARATRSRSPS